MHVHVQGSPKSAEVQNASRITELLPRIAEHGGWCWGQYCTCLVMQHTRVRSELSRMTVQRKGLTAYLKPGTRGEVYDHDNEATQSESEGSAIDEPLGSSGSRAPASKRARHEQSECFVVFAKV